MPLTLTTVPHTDDKGEFRAFLKADSDVQARLTPAEIDECFDLEHALRYAEQLVERAISS